MMAVKNFMVKVVYLIYLLTLLVVFMPGRAFGQTFQRTYGGSNFENFWDMSATGNGGYILAGTSSSYGAPSSNAYLVRIDSMGDTVWTRTYGGDQSDDAYAVAQCADKGYIFCGASYSFGWGWSDGYVTRTDSNGAVVWSKTIGGPAADDLVDIKPAYGGGYIAVGNTLSFGPGGWDILLVRLKENGDTVWYRTIGSLDNDEALAMQQTADSGIVICGSSNSFGAGQHDVFVVKLDKQGQMMWAKTYGGTESEQGTAIQVTRDGGFIITGKTHSFGAFGNDGDLYLIRTNSVGDTLWTRSFGGPGTEWGRTVVETADSGFIVAGDTWSSGGGQNDIYIIKTDKHGDLLWDRAIGGDFGDNALAIQPRGRGYVIGGYTASFGTGSGDFYMLRTDSLANSGCNNTTITTVQSGTATMVLTPFVSMLDYGAQSMPAATVVGRGCVVDTICQAIDTFTSSSVATAATQAFSLYPNPSAGNVTVHIGTGASGCTITLADVSGRLIAVEQLIDGTATWHYNGDLASGLYLVTITARGYSNTQKLIITKQ